MNVDKGCVTASGNDATTAIAKHDVAPHRRRDVLMGSGRRRSVGARVGAGI